jgi:ferredoxin
MADTPTLLLCDCTGTMTLDPQGIEAGCGLACSKVNTFLCRDEAAQAANALETGPVIIACGQEANAFAELAEDLGKTGNLTCVDIRDRAGWSDDKTAAPKMAALIADARLPAPMVPLMDITSEGVCLVYGAPDVALPAAERLAGVLTVTAMLSEADEMVAPQSAMDVVTGRISAASGALGGFEVTVDGFAEMAPAGRGARGFGAPVNGAKSGCDLIVDLSGGQPLFPAHHKRDGYFRADPGDPLAVERVLFDASQMQGTFEKPFYIRFEDSLCAHSRASQNGCTRCLDICPTSAISPGKEAVSIDPQICAGCGACAAVCPSGAASAPVSTRLTTAPMVAWPHR